MDNIFITKLILSFFVGGITIALLGWLAERSKSKIAGVVLSLPSTVVIGYIFIGWTISPQAVADIVPATIITAGAVQAFAISYLYLSKIKYSKNLSIFISISCSLLIWFLFSIPIALTKLSNIYLALAGYITMALIGYYFLTIKNKSTKIETLLKYTWPQKISRAVFAGFIISLAVLLAKVLNPFWGGIFSGFPAVFSSTFLILHWYYGSNMIAKITKAIPVGSIVYVIYIFVTRYTFPNFGIILGTVIAYLVSLVSFLLLYRRK